MGGATLTVRNSIFESNVSGYDGGALSTRDPGAFIDAYDRVFMVRPRGSNAGAGNRHPRFANQLYTVFVYFQQL